MTATMKQTAEQAYNQNAKDVHALLDFIGQEIRMHEEFAKAEGINWAHSGSMGHWRERLIETLISVMGAYEEDEARQMIESALDDLES
jgi:hypothetical protein